MSQQNVAKKNVGTAQEESSNYKGALPSQKYFTPQELNSLGRVGKQPLTGVNRPPSAKKAAPLPKPQQQLEQQMASSAKSFYSDAQVDQAQEAKLKKLAKPFSLTKKSQQFTKPEEIDDLMSEISTPGLDVDLAA